MTMTSSNSNCIFPFALEYQNELVLWQSKLCDKLTYAENLEYSDKLLLTQLFGELAFRDILAVYPKDFYDNSSAPLLVFTSLGLFYKTSGTKYGFYISYYNAAFNIIRKEAEEKFILPVRCTYSGKRHHLEATNPMLLLELVDIMKKCKIHIQYWVKNKRHDFPYSIPSYYTDKLLWENLEKQFAYNTSLPSATSKLFSLPESQLEAEQCVTYQNTRFSRGSAELTAELDKLFFGKYYV